jgi:diguanylate cyclase (GGDEF)-like protein
MPATAQDGNARVLLIDDDPMALTVIRKLLEAEGYDVAACSSAAEAFATLGQGRFDAILCDMWMAEMGGREFYLQLKQDFSEYQGKIVFVTGDVASESTWEFIDERHLPYLIKPISRPLLSRKMQEIVGERPERKPDSAAKAPWDGNNRRKHRRVPIKANVRLRRKKWEAAGPEVTSVSNASRGGLYFVTDRDYRPGMELLVAYPYSGYNDVEQEGYVVRVEELADGKHGVAIAIGEEAIAARAAYAGSEGDARRHHIVTPGDLGAVSRVGEAAGPLDGEGSEKARRLAEENAELKRLQDQIVDQRDRLAQQEADLKRQLAELDAAKFAADRQVNDLQREMESRNQELAAVEEVRYRATHDALTGLLNRAAILDALKEQLLRAQREGKAVGVVLGDLDHFKSVNDTYGHLAGDAVLRESAQRISAAVRSYDAVGRYGGEEFLIILAGCEDDNDMMTQADRIRSHVGSGPVTTVEGTIPVTLSLGAASSSEYQEVEAILRAADTALYQAKRSGRNRVQMASAAKR